jgi:hypothetical protein
VKIINLTPHPITLALESGEHAVIEPSGTIARVAGARWQEGELEVNGSEVPHCSLVMRSVALLPRPELETRFIVSWLVAQAARDRDDLLVVDDLVRDEAGHVIAAHVLARPAPRHLREAGREARLDCTRLFADARLDATTYESLRGRMAEFDHAARELCRLGDTLEEDLVAALLAAIGQVSGGLAPDAVAALLRTDAAFAEARRLLASDASAHPMFLRWMASESGDTVVFDRVRRGLLRLVARGGTLRLEGADAR